ncbi:MAG: PqqD family protein [Chloroflexi bacterium]|nr:PqqD family protein [Chloroflexota bacterium]
MNVVRVAGLQTAPVQDDLVILDLERDEYVALDAVGRNIWEMIETPRSLEDICRQLSKEFDAEPEELAADVRAFVEELVGSGLVRVVDR